jgi:hypothetical protein
MQESFCIRKFCVTELIIIFQTSGFITEPTVKFQQHDVIQSLRNVSLGLFMLKVAISYSLSPKSFLVPPIQRTMFEENTLRIVWLAFVINLLVVVEFETLLYFLCYQRFLSNQLIN